MKDEKRMWVRVWKYKKKVGKNEGKKEKDKKRRLIGQQFQSKLQVKIESHKGVPIRQ